MKEINVKTVEETVSRLCIEANYYLPDDVYKSIEKARNEEKSDICKSVLSDILCNADIAKRDSVPICQDTGLAVVFMEVGQDVHFFGGNLEDAVNCGVRDGYLRGYLRKNTVSDPLISRINTGDNTPAMLSVRIVEGDSVRITVAPKGGGSENMSTLKMLNPAEGMSGVKQFIVDFVSKAGSNPCPPVIVGVGIGGTIEKTTLAAKHSLMREVGEHNPDCKIAAFEDEVLNAVNHLGIGAQGFGGSVTALAVNIETVAVAHMASLPVAINLQCHVARHKTAVL